MALLMSGSIAPARRLPGDMEVADPQGKFFGQIEGAAESGGTR
jgi:hypothetical protein